MSRSPLPDMVLARHFRRRPEPGRDAPDLPRIQPYPASVLVTSQPPGWMAIARTWASAGDIARCRLCDRCSADLDGLHCLIVTRPAPADPALVTARVLG